MPKNQTLYINVLGKKIPVVFVSSSDADIHNSYGKAELLRGIIKINASLGTDIKIQTLLHEIIHFWNEDLGLGLSADDEESHNNIDRLAVAFMLLCKENGIDISKLLANEAANE